MIQLVAVSIRMTSARYAAMTVQRRRTFRTVRCSVISRLVGLRLFGCQSWDENPWVWVVEFERINAAG